MVALINKLQNLKTSIFDIAAIIYGLGLVNWSIYAYSNSLGVVPALDTQYFVAGIGPFLMMLIIYYAVTSKFSFPGRIILALRNFRRTFRRVAPRKVRLTIPLLYIAAIITTAFFIIRNIEKGLIGRICISFVTVCLVVVCIVSFKRIRDATPVNYRRAKLLFVARSKSAFLNTSVMLANYTKFLITSYALILIPVYSLLIYPEIPLELGGARPKPCVIECKKACFNHLTNSVLFNDTTGNVLRSKTIDVFYSNSDKLIIKAYGMFDKPDPDSLRTEHVLEIKRDDIILIDWLEDKSWELFN